MRVIAGTARRLQLKTLDGMDTRPTTDRIKETLFNMISAELYDSNFLDLFSGSGAHPQNIVIAPLNIENLSIAQGIPNDMRSRSAIIDVAYVMK